MSSAAAPTEEQIQQQKARGYVLHLTQNDVLLGRGAPSIDNEGNIRFRRIVQERKPEYVSTIKRPHKDLIARQVIQTVASNQGKFLRKIESLMEAEALGIAEGVTAWAIVDYETILQKVKQALRDPDPKESRAAESNRRRKRTPMVIPTVDSYQSQPTSVATAAESYYFQQAANFRQQQHQHQQQQQQHHHQQQQQQQQHARTFAFQPQPSPPNMMGGGSSHLTTSALSSVLDMTAPTPLPFRNMGPSTNFMGGNTMNSMNSSSMMNGMNPMNSMVSNQHPVEGHRTSFFEQQQEINSPLPPSKGGALFEEKPSDVSVISFEDLAARRRADETMADVQLRFAIGAPSTDSKSLSVSLVEVLVLSTVCAYGLPTWTPAGSDSDWHGLAQALVEMAHKWSHESRLDVDWSKTMHMVASYKVNPATLAKLTVSLLEKLRGLASASQDPLGDALRQWGVVLNMVDPSTSRPSAYTSSDFAQDFEAYRQDAAVKAVACLDGSAASVLWKQCATLHRLRTCKSIRDTLVQAVLYSRFQDRMWTEQPNWWVAVSATGDNHDVALLENVLQGGYNEILNATIQVEGAVLSYKDLGLTKPLLQDRVEQLVNMLARQWSVLQRQKIMEDRAHAYLAHIEKGEGTIVQEGTNTKRQRLE